MIRGSVSFEPGQVGDLDEETTELILRDAEKAGEESILPDVEGPRGHRNQSPDCKEWRK